VMLLPITVLLTVIIIAVDWWAVGTDRVRVEEIAKPLVMVGLIVVSLSVDSPPPGVRPWLVAALVAALLGDVFLLPRLNRFVAGLAAFLVGHLLYVVALTQLGLQPEAVLVGFIVGGVVFGTVGRRVIVAVRGSSLLGPVVAYNLVIAAMLVTAIGTGEPLVGAGALAFAASDAVIGLDRFVLAGPSHRVLIMVLYHLGQVGLVAGIVTA
jgi:uncharacterized membrane protein YhhN